MMDQPLYSVHKFPVGAILWLALGLSCGLGMILLPNPAWLMLAVGPFCVGLALLVWRPRPFAAQCTETALEVMEPRVTIPYDEIQAVRPHGVSLHPQKIAAGARFPIRVAYPGGSVLIPARLNVPSVEVYRFLLEKTPPAAADPKATTPSLRSYAARHLETFGMDHLWAYRARSELGEKFPPVTAQAVFLGLTLGGIAWVLLYAFVINNPGFLFLGCLLGTIGLCCFALSFSTSSNSPARNIKNWEDAGLVICPAGLALVQGALKGEMRWDEVKEVKLESRAPTRIVLKALAADVPIADIYDRPLYHIYQRIMFYWRGEKT